MKGQFTAVVYGEFETTGRRFPVLIAAAVGIAALVSWLATVLLELALTAGALGAAIVGACWLLMRRNDRDAELLAERFTALNEATAHPVKAVPPPVVNHYHLHLAPGATAEGLNWAVPQRDAITTEETGERQ